MDISAILSTALKPLWAKALAAVVLIAPIIVGGWIVINKNRDTKLVDTGREVGRTEAIGKGYESTLKQLEKANAAERNLEAGGERSAHRHAQCLQDSDRPSACDRYRPL